MKNRVKQIRIESAKSQSEFGALIGVSGAAVSRWESGERAVPESAVLSICREFAVNEIWLRTGEGEMRAAPGRAEEIASLVASLMADRPDSFRSALISTLLRLKPDQWNLLEQIYDSIKKAPED